MSAEKWESLTWDWIERELVDYLLITNDRQQKPHRKSLARLLARKPAAASAAQRHDRTQRRSASNA